MNDYRQPDEQQDDIEWVSKSEMKRYAHELKALGEQLLTLDDAELNRMPISERLADAARESRQIKSFSARKRHLQYIGRLMLEEDAEAIERHLDRLNPGSALYRRIDKQAEHWRSKLLETPETLTDFIAEYPQTPVQSLRQALRNAQNEQRKGKPGKHFTNLFRQIREQINQSDQPNQP